MAGKQQTADNKQPKAVLARQSDGTIQLTITIPQNDVHKAREIALSHTLEELEVPGFRKGKVSRDVAMRHIDQQKLYEHTLQHLLPEAYSEAVREHGLRPILSPRFELLSSDEGKDWSIRAITCELPEVKLGDFKKLISDAKAGNIWVPGKDEVEKEEPREEKEQKVIKVLVEHTAIQIPKVLLDEEVNNRLSGLLDQIQKLGLTIDQYLSSTGRTIEKLREEYQTQAAAVIKLELALNRVAEEEKVQVTEAEVEQIISATDAATSKNGEKAKEPTNPHHKQLVRSILLRRKALDSLVALA
ncbi:MAG: trigger factor [bacterium]|nr:trigger factor [bacterium]